VHAGCKAAGCVLQFSEQICLDFAVLGCAGSGASKDSEFTASASQADLAQPAVCIAGSQNEHRAIKIGGKDFPRDPKSLAYVGPY
jgi:hypothetical protein